MQTRLVKLLTLSISALTLSACVIVTPDIKVQHDFDTHIFTKSESTPKNIIMIVADGMGPAYTTAYRYYADDPNTPEIDATIFDQWHVGNSSTYPASVSGVVTDSAASATALASGIKSYNGAIGMDVNKQPVTTVLHRAKAKGMKTGLAVTSQIVHATPAAYVAHNESRQNYNAIADSFFDDRINGEHKVDVMLGGGTDYFIRDDRDIRQLFVDQGYQYIDSYAQLSSLTNDAGALGLFAPVGLPWALDDVDPSRLRTMAQTATRILENNQGYFLLLEASQVDWAGHGRDINSAMAEMQDLHLMLEWLVEYQTQHPETLVVLTADHSTGGLTLAANGEYRWEPASLHGINTSVTAMIKHLVNSADEPTKRLAYIKAQLGFELTQADQDAVLAMDMNAKSRSLEDVIKRIIDRKTNTGWTTWGHTAVDVQVFAVGPGAERFAGHQDNTDIAKRIFELLD
jgi:alkaline phosphatase